MKKVRPVTSQGQGCGGGISKLLVAAKQRNAQLVVLCRMGRQSRHDGDERLALWLKPVGDLITSPVFVVVLLRWFLARRRTLETKIVTEP